MPINMNILLQYYTRPYASYIITILRQEIVLTAIIACFITTIIIIILQPIQFIMWILMTLYKNKFNDGNLLKFSDRVSMAIEK